MKPYDISTKSIGNPYDIRTVFVTASEGNIES